MSFVWSLALSLQFLFLCSLFSSTLTTNSFSLTQCTKCHEDESSALLQFKAGFVISKYASYNPFSYPKIESWMPSTDCCSWKGIECDELSGHVIGIDLSSSQLYGSMDANSSLFHLVLLQSLNLADNDFNYSQIPSRIGELSKLRHLNLSRTAFSGEIPAEISQLSMLLSLDLSDNILPYPYPTPPINLLQLKVSNLKSIIQNSTKLEILLLGYVTISSPVPDILTNLTSLQALCLYHCDLYGEFPVGVFHLPKLRYLFLGYNQNLYGKLPEFHSNALSLIELDATSFYGTLPASIGNLNFLYSFSIEQCNFFGSIPSSLGNLTQLMDLNLRYNKFKGQLPSSLANLSKLRYLGLGGNNLVVETISWIGKLSQLISLDLSSINIGSKLPLCFANLTQLSYLSLPNSNLSGEIPSWLMNLTNLAYLDLVKNNLQGEIPPSFFRLENLAYVALSLNSLQGQLEIGMILKLKMLKHLSLSRNKLTLLNRRSTTNVSLPQLQVLELDSCNLVEFPTFLQDQNELGCLVLSNNRLSSLPPWMWKKRNLQSLSVSNNSLVGEISPLICNLKSLVRLDLSFNNLSGMIPSCLGSFSHSLQMLVLRGNKFSGPIPQTYMATSALKMVDFSYNTLESQLPRALANCRELEYLDVSHNQINDSFPCWLGALPELKVIALRYNGFYGAIRCTRTDIFLKLHIIDLSHNELSGNLPSEMINSWKSMRASNISQLLYNQWYHLYQQHGTYWFESDPYSFRMSNKGLDMVYESLQQFFNLIAIDLSSNKISGEIPNVIGDLKGLVLLNLSNNMLTGSIPSYLGKLSNLEALDLSNNSLSGKIPLQLSELTFLEFFNVSFNNLSGPIPENKQFDTFQGNSFEGNQCLCGIQLLNKCEDPARTPPPPFDGDQDSGSLFEFDWKIVLIGYGGGLIAGLALGSTFCPINPELIKRFF